MPEETPSRLIIRLVEELIEERDRYRAALERLADDKNAMSPCWAKYAEDWNHNQDELDARCEFARDALTPPKRTG